MSRRASECANDAAKLFYAEIGAGRGERLPLCLCRSGDVVDRRRSADINGGGRRGDIDHVMCDVTGGAITMTTES